MATMKKRVPKAQQGIKRTVDDILGTAEQRAENSRKVDSIISARTKELKNPTPKNSNEYTNTSEFRKLLSESAERSNRAAKQAAESIPTKANGGLRKNGGSMKKKMKNGGSLSGLKASNKRVGPVDPKGAFTKVQKKTLKGAKGKASLTKDKQLGATKMAKRGMSIKKK
jgi:hypothetical protein